MRKCYLLLMMLMVHLIAGSNAFAQTDAEYDAAISALGDGGPYRRITTTIEGVRYYVTTSGTLTASVADAGSFDFEKVSGGAFKTYGYKIKNGSTRFTNAPIENEHAVLNVSNLSTTTEWDRSDWEAQVLFLKDGKYAIRACNTADGTSGWNDCGRVFWTTNGITACYSYEPAYIWEVEGLGTDAEYNAAMAAITDGGIYYITTEVDGVTYYLTKDGLLTDDTKDPNLGQFIFNKNTASGFYKSAGFVLESGTGNYFSNPANGSYTDDIITDTQLNLHSGIRDGWEVQVFFLNADGKYAVRSTNCTPASSGWNHVGSAFWTVATGDSSPYPTYEYEPQFIWNLVSPADVEAIEDGQTVRLVHGGKSVFVENSSLDENTNAVLWTETNVNAQRWTLTAKTNGTFLLSNDYTGFYLAGLTSGTAGKVGQTSKSAANSKGSWEFVPVEGASGQYRIFQGTTRKYALAAADDPEEGSVLTIVDTATATNLDPARLVWTVHAVKPMERAFTKDKRDDMMEKWKARAYRKADTGYVIGGGGWWGDAEMFEIVLDALETTGDQQYATMFENLYTNFIARNKDTWYQQGVSGYNPYNDDIAWMCIACVRAYLLTGVTKYRETAKKNFDGMFARADCYGNDLLQWLHNSGQGTNSCINGPAAVCACYLAMALSDDSYYQKARKTYMAERGKLFEMSDGKPTGAVWDSYDIGTGNYNKWCSTYNQGTNLGAAIMLYNHYGEQMFKNDADAIIKWSEANLANSKGIIHVCQTVRGDLTNFKGIMLRYLRMYAETFNAPSHYAWIAKNAYHAWNNRNSAGITSSAWLTKAEENFKHQESDGLKDFSHEGDMTCVSAAFNCHLGVVDSHDAYAMNEAEDFNFLRNAPVTYDGGTDDGGGMVGPMKSNNYIGYRRVKFGNKPASHIVLRTNITLGSTGINVFLDQPNTKSGTLLCSIKGNELAALKTWDTISKMINQPVTGTHDVYFVSTGTGQTNINWWQFQSLNLVYADLTNGGGKLTASFVAEDVSALTDDDITTALTATIETGTETWIQYTSPSPMRLYGYQLFSGTTTSGNAKGWSLQASNDGENWETLHNEPDTQFSVQAQRYHADVQTTKAYTHYRLLFNCNNTQKQLSISEWQLLGRCIDNNDLTADGGTITEGSEALIDHVGTTLVPTPVTAVYRPNGNYLLTAYSITADEAAKAPTSWKLEGSANGTTWKLIDQQTEAVFPYDDYTYVCRVNPGTSYLYYRLTVESAEAQFCQWQLFGKPDYGTFYADLTSIASIISCDGSDATALTDDDGTSYATISGKVPFWDIIVPIPTKALGYSLVSADNAELDPQSIILYGYDETGTETQISSKALTFPARGSRLTYIVSSTKLFNRFRLLAPEGSTVRLADFELYGTAIAEAADPNLLAPASVVATAPGLTNAELIGRISDGNRTTCYHAGFTEPVSITYTYDQPVGINAYSITASKSEPTRDPADWTLEGSNDGNTWTMIDTRSEETFSHRYATQFYTAERAEAFTTFRFTVTATGGASQIQIGELQLLSTQKEDATGISELDNWTIGQSDNCEMVKSSNCQIYNLAGQRLNKVQKGIYIVGGRKVVK